MATFTDGQTKTIGRVVGRDGMHGAAGKDGAPGRDGKDGQDGISLGLEHLQVEAEFDATTRRMIWTLTDGTIRKQVFVPAPVPLFRGPFKSGAAYEAGDMVSYGGSQWIALRGTMRRPDEFGDGAKDWQLCVKKGRDGRDGKDGEKGERGEPGKDGRGFTR